MAGQVIRVRYGGLVRVVIDRLLEPDEARQIAQEILDCADAAESQPAQSTSNPMVILGTKDPPRITKRDGMRDGSFRLFCFGIRAVGRDGIPCQG
jgi:hypothetical protein